MRGGGGGAEGYKPISRLILIDRVVRWHNSRKATEDQCSQSADIKFVVRQWGDQVTPTGDHLLLHLLAAVGF